MGCVLPAGVGQAPARQAAHRRRAAATRCRAPPSTRCAARASRRSCSARRRSRRRADVVVAGGMESMSQRAATCCPRRATGYAWATRRSIDSMIHDGLWDPYNNVAHGQLRRAVRQGEGHHARAPGRVRRRELPPRARAPRRRASSRPRSSPVEIAAEEGPADRRRRRRGARPRRHRRSSPALRPAFQKDGTITAGNASSINDGARGARADGARRRRSSAAASRSRASSARGQPRAGARVVHHRARRRDRARCSSAPAGRPGRRRSVGDQRGVRGRLARQQPAARARPGAGQRVRRRGRARPPDRRLGRARPGDAAPRACATRGKRSAASPRCASAAARASRSLVERV